jgi:hypothetical protein
MISRTSQGRREPQDSQPSRDTLTITFYPEHEPRQWESLHEYNQANQSNRSARKSYRNHIASHCCDCLKVLNQIRLTPVRRVDHRTIKGLKHQNRFLEKFLSEIRIETAALLNVETNDKHLRKSTK